MNEFLTISSRGERFVFDREKKLFSLGDYSFPLAGLFRASQGIPWRLEKVETELVSAASADERLVLLCRTEYGSLKLSFSFDAAGFLRGNLELDAGKELKDLSFSLAFPVSENARFTMPMSCYNGNPSVSEDRVVPRFPASGEASLVFEETRYPIPGVNAESDGVYLSCFLIPGKDHSIGAERNTSGETCCLLSSGCVSFNGKHDEAYEFKLRSVHHPKGYRDLMPGECCSMDFVLHAGTTPFPGEGFRDLVRSGWQIYAPVPQPVLELDEVISRKAEALADRWAGKGYLCVLPDNLYGAPAYYLYGWTGQCFRLALCDIRCGVLFRDGTRIKRGLQAVEYFVDNAESSLPGLYHLRFNLDEEKWIPGTLLGEEVFSSRAMGETFSDLARLLLFCRENGIAYPERFETCLRKGLDFILSHLLEEQIPPVTWRKDGSAFTNKVTASGTSVLSGLFVMYEFTGEKFYLDAGIAMLERFWMIGGSRFDTPFSHATLDSGCEDKEAAVPFFNAAAHAWRLTGEERFKHWAEASGDWLLTWVYFWNVSLREDSVCARCGFKTAGWPAVSVENQHLDVFFPAWEMYRFGEETGDTLFQQAGSTVFAAWSHGISSGNGDWLMPRRGMQAEQFFQTEWRFSLAERYDDFSPVYKKHLAEFGYSAQTIDEKNLRGGCNPWEIAWIISLVLDAALSFKTRW